MDFIRDSVFLTTILHCVLANSHLQNDGLANRPDNYNIVSPVPEIKTLQAPSYNDQIPQTKSVTPYFLVDPSWQNRHSFNRGLNQEIMKPSQQSYKPELPGTALKGIGLKYPLTMPHVKLSFVGTNGMLPVKQIQDKNPEKPEPPNKTTDSDISKLGVNDRLIGRVQLQKSIQVPSLKLDQYVEQALKAFNINHTPSYPDVLYGQNKQPLNPLQFTPSYTPEQLGIYLNPANYLPTNPGYDYGKVQEELKNIQFTPSYERPNIGSVLNLPEGTYTTNPRLNYGKFEDQIKAVQYTSTYKPDSVGIDALKPTDFNYPFTNPGLNYAEVNEPEKANQNTPHRTYVPDKQIYVSTQTGIRGPNMSVANVPKGSLKTTNVDYNIPTTIGVGKENATVELPPVPTTLSLLQRTQLALLNTVAGLPGGNPQALNAVRLT